MASILAVITACCDSDTKVMAVEQIAAALRDGQLTINPAEHSLALIQPGRPDVPQLVAPRDLPKRKAGTFAGRALIYHAITHIEFNAINLALDAICRFADMPLVYYQEWLQVAAEEAYHFSLIRAHLRHYGVEYGDFPAHNGLWEMALKSKEDILLRMALVPRYLEARGLDVNPGLAAKMREQGDVNGAALLEIILRDEVGHVALGDRWYRYCCQQRGIDAEPFFQEILQRYAESRPRPPLHLAARRQAGFSEWELAQWCDP
ncbi:MAG: ferritin-like domain-containing protein [Gammaproteobacteria bacterium]|nr:ferritin-like domain-containing protein [Gammaproteobacteria bacterium]